MTLSELETYLEQFVDLSTKAAERLVELEAKVAQLEAKVETLEDRTNPHIP